MAGDRGPAFLCRSVTARDGAGDGPARRDGEVTPASRIGEHARGDRGRRVIGPGSSSWRADRMTTAGRFERDLPRLLDDLVVQPPPDELGDLLARTRHMRQRPPWTIPGW